MDACTDSLLKGTISLSTRKRKTKSVSSPPPPKKKEGQHSIPVKKENIPSILILIFHPSYLPGLWGIWDFKPLSCGSLGPTSLDCQHIFKQTTKEEHNLSTQYPVLPKYAGFLVFSFLAGSSAINMWSH